MSKAIDAAVKCIEFDNAIYELLEAREPTAIVAAHDKAMALAKEMSAMAHANDHCHALIANTIIRGAIRIERATARLADTSGEPN